MPEFVRTRRRLGDREFECSVCDGSPELYHRTTLEGLRSILATGEVRPSAETGVVSLSASPEHTYGGVVRLVFRRSRLGDLGPLRPMCYVDPKDEPEYSRVRSELLRKRGYDRYAWGYNRLDAETGMTPSAYAEECEVMSSQPIPVDRIEAIEYWIADLGAPYQVSCRRQFPHYVTGEVKGLEEQVAEAAEVARLAATRGIPFRVRSCFPAARTGWYRHAELDESNLSRIARGERPESAPGEPPNDPRRCRC